MATKENKLINGFVDLFFLALSFSMFVGFVLLVGALENVSYSM